MESYPAIITSSIFLFNIDPIYAFVIKKKG